MVDHYNFVELNLDDEDFQSYMRAIYYPMIGKEVYPVAINPLDEGSNARYCFNRYKQFYIMVR